jgi:hypothetical protein
MVTPNTTNSHNDVKASCSFSSSKTNSNNNNNNDDLIDYNNTFLGFIENNCYNGELFTIPIDTLIKAATITKSSNRKLNCFTASNISNSSLLPGDLIINKKPPNNKNYHIQHNTKHKRPKFFKKINSSNNSSKFIIMNNNVSPKETSTTKRTLENKFTHANINQKIKSFLGYILLDF